MPTLNSVSGRNNVAETILKLNSFTPRFNPEAGPMSLADNQKFSVGELKELTNSWLNDWDKDKANDKTVKGKTTKKVSVEQLEAIIRDKTVFKFNRAVFDQGVKDGLIGYKDKTVDSRSIATYLLLSFGVTVDDLKKGTRGKLWDSTIALKGIDQTKQNLKQWSDEVASILDPKTTEPKKG